MSFESLFNILLIILGFGLLIGIHELGHFLAAKWSGIRTNAFAVGMGPQVISFRKGIGFCIKSTRPLVIAKCGKDAIDMTDAELKEFGISETEYSLRLLPIGGFVSMLGQEDGKPEEVSCDPRSYNMCSIGKRMIVVSAGVVMNLLLAIVFFLVCFQVGVRFEAPVVGAITPFSPADFSSLAPGDTIVSINGKPVDTFQNIQIAGAMAKPDEELLLSFTRPGYSEQAEITIKPEPSAVSGMLELGLSPAYSLTLRTGEGVDSQLQLLKNKYPSLNALQPGMTLVERAQLVGDGWSKQSSWGGLQEYLAYSFLTTDTMQTKWAKGDVFVEIAIPVIPELEILRLVDVSAEDPQNYEYGFMGLVPLSKIDFVFDTSLNSQLLEQGDVILRVNSLEAPRMGQLRNYLAKQPDGPIELTVLRNEKRKDIQAELVDGKLGVLLANALDTPIFAQPVEEILSYTKGKHEVVPTAIAGKHLLGGSAFTKAGDKNDLIPVQDWSELRNVMYAEVADVQGNNTFVTVEVRNPTQNEDLATYELQPTSWEKSLSCQPRLTTPLHQGFFDPMYVTRHSGGNPLKALQMGFDETVNMVVMTYLTIDRLFRRTVGVDQLRGPVGIVSIGSKIAGRGFSYLLFFLAIISVNLAVLNFLPLPIVDGGLFLYLIYEKLFKKPPPIAFQNAAAALGLCLIGALFLVTFYNDIARLISGAV